VTLEHTGLRSRRNRRMSVVDCSKLTAVRAGCGLMLPLRRHGRDVAFLGVGLLPSSGLCPDTATSAVVADTIDRVDDGPLVDVVDDGDVYVVYSSVVEEPSSTPVTAFVAHSDVTVTVVDSTVEANVWTPISDIPEIHAIRPSPISWRPEEADLGG
jgi:hypothetical protein